jgi:hypothetical protein
MLRQHFDAALATIPAKQTWSTVSEYLGAADFHEYQKPFKAVYSFVLLNSS